MADPKIERGSIDDPAGPDMSRHYYRPGTTQPELRPEFANEAAVAPTEDTEEKPTLKGKLPEDFPGYSALDNAGLTTYAKVRKNLGSIEDVEGIGPATAEKIREAMGESSEEDEEPE